MSEYFEAEYDNKAWDKVLEKREAKKNLVIIINQNFYG